MSAYVTQDIPIEEAGFVGRIKNFFHREHEEVEAPAYRRKLLDGRIERYLDENFDDYITEYRLVTESKLNEYEARCDILEQNVDTLSGFVRDADADISALERRAATITKEGKRSNRKK